LVKKFLPKPSAAIKGRVIFRLVSRQPGLPLGGAPCNRYIDVMINAGILNPQILSLLARVRHTNALVISDRGFPFWPQIETVDISLVDGVPTVLQVLAAVRGNFNATQAFMAREFQKNNSAATRAGFAKGLAGIPTAFEPHVQFKRRVPGAIGLIRTGDTVQYANLILISG
jgi:D-ribose pyranase